MVEIHLARGKADRARAPQAPRRAVAQAVYAVIEEKRTRLRPARPRTREAHRKGQMGTRRVTTEGELPGVQGEMVDRALDRPVDLVDLARKPGLRCEGIVDAEHTHGTARGMQPHDAVVGVDRAQREPAAVEIDEGERALHLCGLVEAQAGCDPRGRDGCLPRADSRNRRRVPEAALVLIARPHARNIAEFDGAEAAVELL